MTIEENWNAMAKAFEKFTEDGDSYSNQIEWPAIQSLLPELAGKEVLDLGCGAGRYTFLLEELGAGNVTGLDLSEEMLMLARAKAVVRNSKAEFVKGDAADLSAWGEGIFDLVFSSTTLHYLPELGPVFREMARVLKPGGECVLSVMHPVYTAQYPVARDGEFPKDGEWTVRYQDQRLRAYIQPWIEFNDAVPCFLSESYHHTFADYCKAALAAGLTLEGIEEPRPPEEWKTSCPGRYEAFIETPSYLVMKWKKG